jgi:basic membrane protein A
MKGMDVAVEEAIKEGVEGTFTNELYVGTLENGGVGLAPLSDDAADLQDKIDEITQKIIDGEITTG